MRKIRARRRFTIPYWRVASLFGMVPLVKVREMVVKQKVTELIDSFPVGVMIQIRAVFPGEYYVGYNSPDDCYIPGVGSYYPLGEALERCLAAYRDAHNA